MVYSVPGELYLINRRVILINHRLSGLFAITVVCTLLLMAGVGIGSDPNNRTSSSESVADGNRPAKDSTGPTVYFLCDSNSPKTNPASSFMYFVPLIAPTLTYCRVSHDNTQQFKLISYKNNSDAESFYTSCEFLITGSGSQKNTFDANQMIEKRLQKGEEGRTLKDLLDYINLEGRGFGRFEVWGKIENQKETVTEVKVHFNDKGSQSPVTTGIYSVKPVDGQYKYENRYDTIVARINTITFIKTDNPPKMLITIDSIHAADQPEGFLGKLKAFYANYFLEPPDIERVGNDTMLDLGFALYKKDCSFTFPWTERLKLEPVDSNGGFNK